MRARGERLPYRPELDAIRGVAILLVVLQHGVFIGRDEARLGAPGAVGVTLFFVLSGYLITGLLLAEHRASGRVDLRAFYVRRVRRLLPALVAMVAIVSLAGLVGLVAVRPEQPAIALLYVANWAHRAGADLGLFTHTWTLGIEEWFYLAWPAAFLVLVRWPRALAMALVVVIALSVALHSQIGSVMRGEALGAGALLAVWGGRLPRWAGIAGWAGLVGCSLVLGAVPAWLWLAAAGASALVVGSGGFVTWRPLVWLGTISYGLYLWNYPVATLVYPLFVGPAPVLFAGMLAGAGLSIAAAVASARWVEAPFRHTVAREPLVAPVPAGLVRDRARAGEVA